MPCHVMLGLECKKGGANRIVVQTERWNLIESPIVFSFFCGSNGQGSYCLCLGVGGSLNLKCSLVEAG